MSGSNVLRISDAASLGMHAASLLAARPRAVLSAGDLAEALGASEAHLSKVLRRLVKAGVLRSVRGAGGGYQLGGRGGESTLLKVYEAMEGPLRPGDCLLARKVCHGRKCILGKLLTSVHEQVRRHLSATKLRQSAAVFARR